MPTIKTTDNNGGKTLHTLLLNETPDTVKKAYRDMLPIANTPLKELVKTNPGLLIFPLQPNLCKDGISDTEIIRLNPISAESDSYGHRILSTGNLIGFIGCGNTVLNITSRFEKNNREDFFLHYMLQKVMNINLFDLKNTFAENNSFNFMFCLFPLLLKKATAQGIYRTYQTFNHNDSAVKGVITLNRHIRKNTPFCGTIAYRNREYCYDNPITQLVRHTIEYIQTKKIGRTILAHDTQTNEAVRLIKAVTTSYNPANRQTILHKNFNPVRHPCYTEYTNLQQLCLMILRHTQLKYADSTKHIYGILFDGAWLWEEYLWILLKKYHFKHPLNKTGTGAVHLFKTGRNCYPDFYRTAQKEETAIVLDAKYKHMENKNRTPFDTSLTNIHREDLYQLITYMHILPADYGAVIFPSDIQHNILTDIYSLPQENELAGTGGKINTFGIPIPQNASTLADFSNHMTQTENHFHKKILQILHNKP